MVQCPKGRLPRSAAAGYQSGEFDQKPGSRGQRGRPVAELAQTQPAAAGALAHPATGRAASPRASLESRRSWIAAWILVGLLAVSYGSTVLAGVGLKPITADLGTRRPLAALAPALILLRAAACGALSRWGA